MPADGAIREMHDECRAPLGHDVGMWGATVTIALPDEVMRHPALLDLAKAEAPAPCAVHRRFDGVRVGFAISGDTFDDARTSTEMVARRILGRIAIPECHAELALRDRGNPAGDWIVSNLT